ncbi:MAG: hypothetical protein NWR72_13505, partial [Bacteroidia bacterium]|nr:hypothetical protein [Bacteroidia bacterium]
MSKITVSITPNQLTESQIATMWQIYQKYYQYTQESFVARTSQSTHFAFYHDGEELVGFTGLRLNESQIGGKPHAFIYFGQTVLEKAYRGRSLLQATGTKLVLKYARFLLTGKVFWWCDALTYRSYLAFARSVSEYYPSRHNPLPPQIREVFDHLGETYYADTYQRATCT